MEAMGQVTKESLLKQAHDEWFIKELEIESLIDPEFQSEFLGRASTEIYWEMAWRWYYRDKFDAFVDWTFVVGESDIKDPESIEACIISPWLIASEQINNERKFTSGQLALFLLKEMLFKADSPRRVSDVIVKQRGHGMKMEEIIEARRLLEASGYKGIVLFDFWFDPGQPVLACPWPRQT